jgi:hypothetical protein
VEPPFLLELTRTTLLLAVRNLRIPKQPLRQGLILVVFNQEVTDFKPLLLEITRTELALLVAAKLTLTFSLTLFLTTSSNHNEPTARYP